jgi:hypothetical protein
VVAVAAGLGALVGLPASARESVGDFRAKMEKWVETRRITSEERADWGVEKETLRATRDLLSDERKALQAEIQQLEESFTQADEERRELLLQRGEFQRSNQAVKDRIRVLEEQAKALATQLPEPLQKKLEPLLVQIPDDPETTRQPLGGRLVNVLGVLAQTEKWNGTATFVGETRAVEGDQKVQVRTLYWGLGQAIYVDAQATTAGIGRPGPDGWHFTNEPELARPAKLLLDIYEGNVDAIEFVPLPVEIDPPAPSHGGE